MIFSRSMNASVLTYIVWWHFTLFSLIFDNKFYKKKFPDIYVMV